jgi:phosphopentomutase
MMNRVIVIVLDGVGVGAAPDAGEYGDESANTLAHVADAVGGLTLPNLQSLGLGHIGAFFGIQRVGQPLGCFGRMAELSHGKDATAGHWEMVGLVTKEPFPTYPEGLPERVIEAIQETIGRKVLGNRAALGADIVKELGREHVATACPILYTNADSVVQIAAHERVIPKEELYRMCRAARQVLRPPHRVARVVAQPFTGEMGAFVGTEGRKHFSVEPPGESLLDSARRAGYPVVGVGRIDTLFCGRGFTRAIHTLNNTAGMGETVRLLANMPKGLIFANLVDIEGLHGYRDNAAGFAQGLQEFDLQLAGLLGALKPGDLLCLAADHGHDLTQQGGGHSREYVPLLAYGPKLARGVNLGTRKTFADLGQTVSDAFGLDPLTIGESFLNALRAG